MVQFLALNFVREGGDPWRAGRNYAVLRLSSKPVFLMAD